MGRDVARLAGGRFVWRLAGSLVGWLASWQVGWVVLAAAPLKWASLFRKN